MCEYCQLLSGHLVGCPAAPEQADVPCEGCWESFALAELEGGFCQDCGADLLRRVRQGVAARFSEREYAYLQAADESAPVL